MKKVKEYVNSALLIGVLVLLAERFFPGVELSLSRAEYWNIIIGALIGGAIGFFVSKMAGEHGASKFHEELKLLRNEVESYHNSFSDKKENKIKEDSEWRTTAKK